MVKTERDTFSFWIKGQWLKAAGFEAGQYVEVVCEGNKIILSKTTALEPTTNKSY